MGLAGVNLRDGGGRAHAIGAAGCGADDGAPGSGGGGDEEARRD